MEKTITDFIEYLIKVKGYSEDQAEKEAERIYWY